MRRFKHRVRGILCLLCALLLTQSALSGVVGKVVGRVSEQRTGEALVGANVSLVGTTMGTATDGEGRYFLLNVPAGTYTLRVTFVGRSTYEVRNVRVVQDLATEINAALPEQTVELGEVIEVVAERPMIQKEVSASVTTVSAEEFRNRPIESIQSIVNTSAGVVTFQGQTFIRGSRSTEVGYVIDGVPLTNPITGGLMTDISKNAVEEVVVMTGGFSAEYGNAMGGIVNVTTKEGGSTYAGSLRYKTDKLTSGSQYYQNVNIWDGTIGGPIVGPTTFFLTGYLNLRDMNVQRQVLAPDGTNLGRHPHEGYQEYRTTAKLTVPLSSNMKLRFTGSLNRAQQLLYNLYWRFGSSPDLLDRYGATWQKTGYAAATFDHVVTPTLFYTAKFGYLDWRSRNGQRDRSEWSGSATGITSSWWKDFKFRTPFLDQNYRIPGDPNVYAKWRLRDSKGVDDVRSVRLADSVSFRNPYGIPGGIQNTVDAPYFQNFVWAGDRDFYEENRNRQFSLRLDLTTQPTSDYEVKAGFEAIWHRVNRFQIGAMSALNGVGVTYPVIDFYEKSPSDTALTIRSASSLGSGYTPIELAGYLATQLRFEGMYVNLGLRYDYYNAETAFRRNPIETAQSNPFKQTRVNSVSRSQLSPRIGISFPLTDRLVLRFNYGQFFQRPPMDRLFSYLWIDLNQADVYQGNPNIEAQKTVAYEVGLAAVLSEDFSLNLTAFQKNMFNLEGYRIFRAPDLEWYFQAVNQEYGESYGFEVSVRKRYSNWLSGFLNYTFSIARGTASDVSQIARYPLTSITYAKQLGYEPLYPQDTMPLDFDRTHSASIVIDFNVPHDEGPTLFGVKPLSGFGINLTGSLQSGTPYTRMTSFFVNLTTDRFNSATFPPTYSLDMRIHKDFRWSGVELSLFAEILNVLNLNQPFSVFLGSGNPDEPGYRVSRGAISPESYPSNHPLYSKRSDTNNDGLLDPGERFAAYQRLEQNMLALMSNYPLPRRALFGIELRF